MAVNVPEVQVLADSENTVILKVAAYFDAATSSNTKILTSNTVRGANTSRVCMIDVEKVQYSCQMASGYVSLEYQGAAANSKIYNLGGRADGQFISTVPNNATGPTGDLNLAIVNAGANDVVNLVLTLRKNNANQAFNNVHTWF